MADKTFVWAIPGRNPPHELSEIPSPAYVDSRAESTEAWPGAAVVPAAAAAAEQSTTGEGLEMSRRQALGVAAVPVALALAAIPPAVDPGYGVWRRWQAAERERACANDAFDRAADSLPADLQPAAENALHIEKWETEKLLQQYRPIYRDDHSMISHWEADLERITQRLSDITDAQRSAGLLDLSRVCEAAEEKADAAFGEVASLQSPTPASVAAQLHAGLFLRSADVEISGYPCCLMTAALHALLPSLPVEMRTAIESYIAEEQGEEQRVYQESANQVRTFGA